MASGTSCEWSWLEVDDVLLVFPVAGRLMSERATGIEPAYLAWEASALPLSYARMLREF